MESNGKERQSRPGFVCLFFTFMIKIPWGMTDLLHKDIELFHRQGIYGSDIFSPTSNLLGQEGQIWCREAMGGFLLVNVNGSLNCVVQRGPWGWQKGSGQPYDIETAYSCFFPMAATSQIVMQEVLIFKCSERGIVPLPQNKSRTLKGREKILPATHQFFLVLGVSYFLLLEYHRSSGMPIEGRVMTPKAAQSSLKRKKERDEIYWLILFLSHLSVPVGSHKAANSISSHNGPYHNISTLKTTI